MDLTTMHPDQGKIFRLWQIYLDNVNPLLKVTHTPTLQPRIVEAMGDLASIHPSLEALLFGIYCIAVLSISEDQCRALFGSPKKDVMAGYQFACRQALINCNILRWSDRDSLTALFLNLVSGQQLLSPVSGYPPLTPSLQGLGPVRHGSSVSLVGPRRRHAPRTTHGLPRRVPQRQMHPL